MELRKLYWKVIISNIINSYLERQDFLNKISDFFPKIKEYDDEFRIECRSELYNTTLNNDEKIKQKVIGSNALYIKKFFLILLMYRHNYHIVYLK